MYLANNRQSGHVWFDAVVRYYNSLRIIDPCFFVRLFLDVNILRKEYQHNADSEADAG